MSIITDWQGLSGPDLRLAQAGSQWINQLQSFFPDVSVAHILELAKAASIDNELVASNVNEQHESVMAIVENLLSQNGGKPATSL